MVGLIRQLVMIIAVKIAIVSEIVISTAHSYLSCLFGGRVGPLKVALAKVRKFVRKGC